MAIEYKIEATDKRNTAFCAFGTCFITYVCNTNHDVIVNRNIYTVILQTLDYDINRIASASVLDIVEHDISVLIVIAATVAHMNQVRYLGQPRHVS